MKKTICAVLAALMAVCALPLTAYADNDPGAIFKFYETISVHGVIYDDGTGEVYYYNDSAEPYTVIANEVGSEKEVNNYALSLTAQEINKSISDWATEMGVSIEDRELDSRIVYPPAPYFGRSTGDPDAKYYEPITDAQYGECITRYDEARVYFVGHIYTEPQILTGWQYIDGKWYYYNSEGVMQTGWLLDGGKWYFLKSDGVMATGWVKSGSAWYFMNKNGSMATGWVKSGSAWYFMKSNGAMATGWVKSGGKWYYMEASGRMLANTSKKIGNKTYKFNSSGVCLNP